MTVSACDAIPSQDRTKRQVKRNPESSRSEPPFPLYASHSRNEDDKNASPPLRSYTEGFESVIQILRAAKKIVVLTGAGISVSCGIPDFRSKGTGLYSTLDAQILGLSCPEELFDYEFFQENPLPFYQFARNLYYPLGTDERVRPSDAHKLLALLDQKHKLLRVYSQNIDGLEQDAGVSSRKVVYAHGSLQWATCSKCKRKVDASEIQDDIKKGVVAKCQAPIEPCGASYNIPLSSRSSPRSIQGKSNSATGPPSHGTRKRSRETASSKSVCGGVMKPGVTFFGETLHDNVRRCLEVDRDKVDALIVIGTSLSVAPISKVVGYLPANIPRILINRTIVHPYSCQSLASSDDGHGEGHVSDRDFRENYVFDAYLLGFCDDVARAVAKRLFAEKEAGTRMKETQIGTIHESERPFVEGKLLEALDDDDDHYNKTSWMQSKVAAKIPPERIFLFPGAQAPSNEDYAEDGDDDGSSVLTYREVAHCDGCSERIVGIIHKCVVCFDYDLCRKCFAIQSSKHFDGSHQFVKEAACPMSTTNQSE